MGYRRAIKMQCPSCGEDMFRVPRKPLEALFYLGLRRYACAALVCRWQGLVRVKRLPLAGVLTGIRKILPAGWPKASLRDLLPDKKSKGNLTNPLPDVRPNAGLRKWMPNMRPKIRNRYKKVMVPLTAYSICVVAGLGFAGWAAFAHQKPSPSAALPVGLTPSAAVADMQVKR